jgi:hypothetical protein
VNMAGKAVFETSSSGFVSSDVRCVSLTTPNARGDAGLAGRAASMPSPLIPGFVRRRTSDTAGHLRSSTSIARDSSGRTQVLHQGYAEHRESCSERYGREKARCSRAPRATSATATTSNYASTTAKARRSTRCAWTSSTQIVLLGAFFATRPGRVRRPRPSSLSRPMSLTYKRSAFSRRSCCR